MRIRIVVSYLPRYLRGHAWHMVPPVTGMHLAALTPREHEVDLVHEQVRPVPVDGWPDLVAISFFSGFARRAYEVADAYRALGVPVVAGGPHVTYWVDEALQHFDAVVTGEADAIWPRVVEDFSAGTPDRVYRGGAPELAGLPTPRYDLLEPAFMVPRVLQATRGCPFTCGFCTVPDLNPGFRVRPVEEVVRDVAGSHFPHWWQERLVWFWDDNLLVQRAWAKDLLRELRGLDRWWLTQASIDIVRDPELLDLMEASGCAGIFLGIESFEEDALESVTKRQNRVAAYGEAVERLHDRGICVMAGFIAGFDCQTPESIVRMADQLQELEFDVPFLSILTPFRGTRIYQEWLGSGRLRPELGWDHYNGYNVAFTPARMTPDELLRAHRELWDRTFSPGRVAARLVRGARQLSRGGQVLSAAMNGFYGLKRLTRNLPAEAGSLGDGRILHPSLEELADRLDLGVG